MYGSRCLLIGVFVFIFLSSSVPLQARNCRPTFKGKDRITKLQFAEWTQLLYKPGFLAGMVASTSEIEISGTVIRTGGKNKVNIVLYKQESNANRAAVESPYKAEKGNAFVFGFKEGGEPLTFVADSVSNDVNVDMFGNINTKVVLTAEVRDEDLAALKDALAGRHIDAVRISLANNLTIEQSVNEDNSEAFTAKIQCWLAPEEKP
jgi:hypothetical protein